MTLKLETISVSITVNTLENTYEWDAKIVSLDTLVRDIKVEYPKATSIVLTFTV